jgi:hypothetical protein
MSHSCQEATYAPQQTAPLFDDLVGGHEQFVGHSEAEHPGGLMIDDELELARLHDRQVRGLRALEDAAGIEAALAPRIHNVGSIVHQPADFGKIPHGICRGQRVARRQLDQLSTPAVKEGIEAYEERIGPLTASPR